MNRFKELFIGDRQFYKMVLVIALPILVQNGITNFVNLLDNIMVGQLGTEQMSGVAIVNQLVNVYGVCIFGAVSGASIFAAQYFGQRNYEGVRHTFRFKLICCLLVAAVWMLLFGFAGGTLIDLFLNDADAGNVLATHDVGIGYLHIMMVGLLPYMMSVIYASTLRENGQTVVPMIGSMAAVGVNFLINYTLIFGNFGFPRLGVVGAAIGTAAARFLEMAVIVIWTHRNREKNPFIVGIYRSFEIPRNLIKQILKKGSPLMINEALWAVGQAVLVQCYSMRGLEAVAALNITTTVQNMFNIIFIALGSAISIVVGQQLGAGNLKKAVDTDRKMMFFSVACCVAAGAVLFLLSAGVPEIYNTSAEVKRMAVQLLRIVAVFMPVYAFYHAAYFTLRSGGKTFITFLFDSCYVWIINIPIAFFLSRWTGVDMISVFLACQCAEIMKVVIGCVLLKKRIWVNNIVSNI
ncbi:MAG: MATE family efflux transporter [Eubacterium sp.]|nr:MATE family efflux transporter [Eubacterium sp.]